MPGIGHSVSMNGKLERHGIIYSSKAGLDQQYMCASRDENENGNRF